MNKLIFGSLYKTVLSIALLSSIQLAAFAQKSSLQAVIYDKTSNEIIPYASVLLSDSVQNIKFNTFSDKKGEFKFTDVKPGNYTLYISFIGYQVYNQKDIKIDKENLKINLGSIFMISSSTQLNEVEVTVARKTHVHKIDRQVYSSADFTTTKGGTAADILSKLPSVNVAPDGTVSVRGSSDFAVYINGKPTQMDASTLLSQTSADQIENVEIISVPTSKFDAQGKGGIVNITTKRTGNQGLTITASGLLGGAPWGNKTDALSGYHMNDNRSGANLNLMYSKNKWSLFGAFNMNDKNINGNRDGDARILVADNVYKHMIAAGERPEWYKYLTASAGFEYQLSTNASLAASYFHGNRTDARSAFYTYNIFYADKLKNNISGIDTRNQWIYNPNTDSRDGSFNTANLDFTQKFNNKSELKLSLQYENSDFSRALQNQNFAFDINTNTIGAKKLDFIQTDRTPLEGGRLSVDYSKTFTNGHKLGLGLQPQYFNIKGGYNYDTLNIVQNKFLPFNALNNDIEMQRGIYAGYLDYTGNIGKLNFVAGLRAEYLQQLIDIKMPNYFSILHAATDKQSSYSTNKLDLFHSLILSYRLTDNDKINFATSRRINRPALKNMTPFLYRRHLEVYEVGDPTLKPEYLTNFELTYDKTLGKQNVSIIGFMRNVDNAVFRVNTVTNEIPSDIANQIPEVKPLLNEEVLIRSYTNAGNSYATGLELNANFDIATKLKIFAGGSIFNYRVKGDIFGYKVNNSSTNWTAKTTINYLLNKELKLSADYAIKSATVTAQGQNDLFSSANAALTYSPIKMAGWEFSAKVLDLFASNIEGLDTQAFNKNNAEIFYQTTDYYRYGPIAELTISYSFNSKRKVKKATESIMGKEQF